MKIMLATDNHIGYLEKDPVRGQDSFNAFREILQLARDREVDFVLLAGDLFHDNNPSRYTQHQTMCLLREFSHGDTPVQIELLSDPDEGRPDGFTFPSVNYEDYNINIGMPVFSIHGNHDDPQGTSAAGALSAVDLLSAAGLINYFGKTDLAADDDRAEGQKKGLNIKPVLLKKGTTKLALYGIGNIRDNRLNAEMRNGRVRMLRPAEDPDGYFNCLLVHQNRVAHNKNEFVPEDMFDDSTDLVVWGHEHDCRIVPEAVAEKDYWITQPGSSVATSLAEGEALEKKVAILSIQGKEFDIEPIPLRSVRPFVMRQLEMADAAEEHGIDLASKQKVTAFLREQVKECIIEANKQWDERNKTGGSQDVDKATRPKPLVRLRVETTGVSELTNIPRFGESLDQLVANPGNLLQFHRRRVISKKNNVQINQPGGPDSDDDGQVAGQRANKVRMADLVHEYLSVQNLAIFDKYKLEEAVETFVEKGTKGAIKDFVAEQLKERNRGAREKNLNEDDDIEGIVSQQRAVSESQFQRERESSAGKKKKIKAGSSNPLPPARCVLTRLLTCFLVFHTLKKRIQDSDEDGMGTDEAEPAQEDEVSFGNTDSDEADRAPAKKTIKAAPIKKAPARRAATTAKRMGKQPLFDEGSDDDDSDVSMARNDDDDDINESDEVPAVKKKAFAKASSYKASTRKAAPAKKIPAKKASQLAQSQLSFEPAPRRSKAPIHIVDNSD